MSEVLKEQYPFHGRGTLTLLISEYLALSVVLLVLVNKVIKRVTSRKRNDFESLPGPYNIPFIGAVHKLPTAQDSRKVMHEFGKKYGPIWKVKALTQNIVVISGAPHVQVLLSSTEMGHLTRCPLIHEMVFGKFVSDGLIRSSGELWKTHRRIFTRAFTYKQLLNYFPIFTKYSRKLALDLEALFADDRGEKFHQINKQIHCCGIEIIADAVMGLDTSSNGHEAELFYESVTEAKVVTALRVNQPWLLVDFIWRLHPRSRQYDHAIETMDTIIRQMINKQSSEQDGTPPVQLKLDESAEPDDDNNSSLETFRHMLELMQKTGMSETHMLDEIKTMIVAGFETTSALVHFFLFMIALNPENQDACRQEIDSIFNDPMKCPEGELTFDALPEMKYTERCLLETLRVLPVVHAYNRKLDSPLRLDEKIELPAGTTVLISTDLLHKNPEYYPDPEKFDPDRFLPENCVKRHPFAFMPFASGPRNCIGWKFATMQAKTMVGYILRNFEIYTLDKLEDVPLMPAVVLLPERDYYFRLKKRCL